MEKAQRRTAMPTYKVQVTEVRHVECSYWVDVQIEVGDEFEEARRLAEKGETVHEKKYGYFIAGRIVSGEPKLDDLTPKEHLECQADGLEEGSLDDRTRCCHRCFCEEDEYLGNVSFYP
jgi:hypothetical protein